MSNNSFEHQRAEDTNNHSAKANFCSELQLYDAVILLCLLHNASEYLLFYVLILLSCFKVVH